MRDLIARVADDLGLTATEREQQIPSGGTRVIASRVHWAKTYLKQAGLLEQPKRGDRTDIPARARAARHQAGPDRQRRAPAVRRLPVVRPPDQGRRRLAARRPGRDRPGGRARGPPGRLRQQHAGGPDRGRVARPGPVGPRRAAGADTRQLAVLLREAHRRPPPGDGLRRLPGRRGGEARRQPATAESTALSARTSSASTGSTSRPSATSPATPWGARPCRPSSAPSTARGHRRG